MGPQLPIGSTFLIHLGVPRDKVDGYRDGETRSRIHREMCSLPASTYNATIRQSADSRDNSALSASIRHNFEQTTDSDDAHDAILKSRSAPTDKSAQAQVSRCVVVHVACESGANPSCRRSMDPEADAFELRTGERGGSEKCEWIYDLIRRDIIRKIPNAVQGQWCSSGPQPLNLTRYHWYGSESKDNSPRMSREGIRVTHDHHTASCEDR